VGEAPTARLCVLACALFAFAAHAETIVVDPASTRFPTISKAANFAKAGDVISVKPGVYREKVQLKNSGTSDAPIRFVAERPGTVVVTGADVLTGFERMDGESPIYRVFWPHVFAIDHQDGKPVEHHPDSAPLWGRAEQVICDGRLLLPCKDLADLRDAWKSRDKQLSSPVKNLGGPFAGMFAVDTTYHVLYLWLADGSDPKQHTIEASTRSQIFGVSEFDSRAGLHDVQVSGFVFRYAANFPQRAAVVLHGKNNLVEHCIIEKMNGTGVDVNGMLRRCLIRENGHTGGSAQGDGFVNEESVWQGNSWKPIDRGWESGGAKVCNSRGGQFTNCIFYRNGGPGLWFDIDDRDIAVTDCAFVENELSGLFIEISQKIRVENCFTARNAIETTGEVPGDAWSCGGIQIAESMNCTITKNVCVENKDGIAIREIGPRPVKIRDQETIYHISANTIANNTLIQNRGYDVALWWDNNFFGPHPSAKPGEDSKNPSYDPLQQQLQIDSDTFGANPKFLYGAPWRERARRLNSLAEFQHFTRFEKNGKLTNEKTASTQPVEDRIKSYQPFAPGVP
jgi:hypothetical protein